MSGALELTERLIAAESVTPARGAVFDVLEAALVPLGFAVHRFVAGAETDAPVENLFAMRAGAGRHFAFAGHLDVVPPGAGWTSDPFVPTRRGDLLHGRGAVDMKGAIAAFVAAVAARPNHAAPISLIVTGDEEGPAVHGTRALIDWMGARGIAPDLCLVGEPTSVARLGDMIKIGRRGSVNMWVRSAGRQGHVAYPHLAENPIPRLIAALAEIERIALDTGTDWFQPSNIEITDLAVGNPAHNVIPAAAEARLSIRFNDLHTGASLTAMIEEVAARHGCTLEAIVSGEPFLTPPGAFSELVSAAIVEATGVEPELSTSGGTSDARFLARLCPVVEFGLVNATMHKLDEAVAVQDLDLLADIYAGILDRVAR